jgi:hypothetical protein
MISVHEPVHGRLYGLRHGRRRGEPGTAALLGIFASTVCALATAPGDKPLSTVRRVIFTLGTLSSVGFFYFAVQIFA